MNAVASVAVHTAATGEEVAITLPTFDISEPATSHVVGFVDGHRQEFVTGVKSFAPWAAEHVAEIELDLTYQFSGGELLAGTTTRGSADPDERRTALVWVGKEWSLYMFALSTQLKH